MKQLIIIMTFVVTGISFGQNEKDSTVVLMNQILEVNREMEREFNKGNYAIIGEYYSDSAAMVGNKVEIIGKSNLINYWSKFQNAHEWKLENIEIKILAPNVALQRGFSIISYYNNDTLKTSKSIFSLIWIKNDNEWKILVDHFSPR